MSTMNIYNSFLEDSSKGSIDMDTDTFKTLLVTSTYTFNKDTHLKRSDITNEVANGNGYTTGGTAQTVTVTKDTANDRLDLTFAAISWPASTITARGAVIYKARGGASTADELVCEIDFGGDVTSTGATFSLSQSILRYQN